MCSCALAEATSDNEAAMATVIMRFMRSEYADRRETNQPLMTLTLADVTWEAHRGRWLSRERPPCRLGERPAGHRAGSNACPNDRPDTMTRFVPLAAVYLSGCLAIPAASAAPRQQTTSAGPVPRSAVVTATTEAITIDGVLDEPIWSSAPKIGDLIQRQPAPGRPPTERTDVTLLYDRRQPLRRRRLLRLRAAAGHRHADGARRQPGLRRSHRDPARHLSRPAQRVLLRDESIRAPSWTAWSRADS